MSDKNILEQLVDAIKGKRTSEGNPYHDARGRFTSGGGGGGTNNGQRKNGKKPTLQEYYTKLNSLRSEWETTQKKLTSDYDRKIRSASLTQTEMYHKSMADNTNLPKRYASLQKTLDTAQSEYNRQLQVKGIQAQRKIGKVQDRMHKDYPR